MLEKFWIRLTGLRDIRVFDEGEIIPSKGDIIYENIGGEALKVLCGSVNSRFTAPNGKQKIFLRVWTKPTKYFK